MPKSINITNTNKIVNHELTTKKRLQNGKLKSEQHVLQIHFPSGDKIYI